MARCESIQFVSHTPEFEVGAINWVSLPNAKPITLPQISWKTGEPWREVNMWLLERSRKSNIKTVRSNAKSLHAYAQWLEQTWDSKEPVQWWDFPEDEADRCLVRYRGFLIRVRDSGHLAPSTTTARMRAAIRFYRWVYANRLISPRWPMWRDRKVVILLTDSVWFERTITVTTTDLSIPNRKRNSYGLEDGLLPVSPEERTLILQLASQYCSTEFQLMLRLGFATGMRLGSICDLKIGTILNAIRDPGANGAFLISIGPSARPPVATKLNTYGHVMVPGQLFNDLRQYSRSPQRLLRQAKANGEDKTLLFLTRFGNPYATKDESNAVNGEMHRFRRIARGAGYNLDHLRFHMTRATFACDAMRLAVKYQKDGIDPVEVVMDLLFHAKRRHTEPYLRFIKKQPLRAEIANEFTHAFLGMLEQKRAYADA